MHFIEKYQNPVAARNNPKQMYGIFMVSVLVLAFFITTLEQIGTPLTYLTFMSLGLLVLIYPVVGFLSRTMKHDEYYLAGRRGHTVFNGMAIAGGLLTGSIYISLSGEVYHSGASALYILSGVLLGLAVSSLMFANPISRNAAFTIPQFVAGDPPRQATGKLLTLLTMGVLATTCILLLLAQLSLMRQVARLYLDLSETLIIVAALGAMLCCLLPGGVRGLTWARVGFYSLAAIAFLFPVIWLSVARTSSPIPQLAYGSGAIELLNNFEQELDIQGFKASARLVSVTDNILDFSILEFVVLIFGIAAGTAAMPHVLQHFATSGSGTSARNSANWGMAFLVVVLTAVPAYAAFVKLELYNLIVGLPVAELGELVPWLFGRGQLDGVPLVQICGTEAVSIEHVKATCANGQPYVMAPEDFKLHETMVLMEAGAIADLPGLFSILIAIGAFAALFSTIDGLLLATANTISHDGFKALVRPRSPESTTLFLSRAIMLAVAIGGGYASLNYDLPIDMFYASAFALSAAGLFPALLLRSVWPDITSRVLLPAALSGVALAVLHGVTNVLGFDLLIASGDEILWLASDKLRIFPVICSGFLGALCGLVVGAITHQVSKPEA